jgi:hypothetical protein
MEDIIHFRTKYFRASWIWSAAKYISGRSSEASEIRSVEDFDDARDIVWKKSTWTTIYKKNRVVPSRIEVALIIPEMPIDREKKQYFDSIKTKIEISCRFTRDSFHYRENENKSGVNFDTIGRDKLVILVTSSIEVSDYERWMKEYDWNDIVILMVYLPSELDASEGILFESHIPKESYYREIHNRIAKIEKILHSSWISNILLRSTDNISLKLNHFFKYRYG